MIWRGQWDGQWDGRWEGLDEPLPAGSISGVARITIAAAGDLQNAEVQAAPQVVGGSRGRRLFWHPAPQTDIRPAFIKGAATITITASGTLDAKLARMYLLRMDDEELMLMASGWR